MIELQAKPNRSSLEATPFSNFDDWRSAALERGILPVIGVTGSRGKTTVVRPGPEFGEVAVNELKEDSFASPAVSGGKLFIRTVGHLYCIGRSEGEE